MSHNAPDQPTSDSTPLTEPAAREDSPNSTTPGPSANSPDAPGINTNDQDNAPLDLEALKAKAAKADQHWDLYLRTRAEFDNYRRRATRDRQEAVQYASLGLIERLLPVLDSFDMALAATQSGSPTSVEALQQGITMVQSQLRNVLAETGLQEVNAHGQVFNPNLHEAVAHHESAEVADGHVLQQIRKGYLLHDRLVRPATVVVAKKSEA